MEKLWVYYLYFLLGHACHLYKTTWYLSKVDIRYNITIVSLSFEIGKFFLGLSFINFYIQFFRICSVCQLVFKVHAAVIPRCN